MLSSIFLVVHVQKSFALKPTYHFGIRHFCTCGIRLVVLMESLERCEILLGVLGVNPYGTVQL